MNFDEFDLKWTSEDKIENDVTGISFGDKVDDSEGIASFCLKIFSCLKSDLNSKCKNVVKLNSGLELVLSFV